MRIFSLLSLAVLTGALAAGDWPQYRGPDATAISKETGLLKKWPKEGLKPVWKTAKAGKGYAGLAVVGGVVYTMGAFDKDEYAIAFDAKGKELWKTKLGPVHDWDANTFSYGPNATPTVEGDHVYALSSKGLLVCLEKKAGKEVWKVDLYGKLGGRVNKVGGGDEALGWGYSASPLIDGDAVVALPGGPGGLFATFNKKDGTLLWRSKAVTDPATYSTPTIATIGGVKQYIAITQDGVVAVAAKDGAKLWEHRRQDPYPDVVCPTPVVRKDEVLVSVGYGGGLDCLKVTEAKGRFAVKSLWSSKKALGNNQGGVALVGDHLYGYHEKRQWACVDVTKKGAAAWKQNTALKAGGLVVADGRLYIFDEEGKIAMVEATPAKFAVISSFKLPEESKQRKPNGGIWTHPSLSDGKLYVRDQELIFGFDVKGK